MATPRATGLGFSAYAWAATAAEIAARHGLSPAHVLRFDANLPALPAPLAVAPRPALASRGEYPEGTYRGLREAAAAYAGCAPEEVVVDAGADGLLHLVARTFLAPGRRAVVERPTYPLYAIASRIEGAAVEEVERDLAALARAARGADVLWLCNPGNPGGEVADAAEIGRLADALPETLVCVDEAYFEYCGETTVALARTRGNLVAVRTLSKAFGLAGLRIGYAVASPAVAQELTSRRAPAPIANAAALLAAAALGDPGPARAEVAAAREERERVRRGFLDGGFESPLTHTNFVVVRSANAPELAAQLERRGLVVRGYPRALRITVRTPAEDDLVLRALGLDAPRPDRRSSTVFGERLRVSLVLDGNGRAAVRTGDDDRDDELEARARAAGWDLEVAAEPGTPAGAVESALRRAEEEASV